MIRHRWKILTCIATIFVFLTVIEVVTIGNGPKKEVEAYKKSLLARGEKLNISELPPLMGPARQNGMGIIAQRLSAAAMADLHRGETSSAVTNICAILGLVNGEKKILDRVEASAEAANATWELLQSNHLNDQELVF